MDILAIMGILAPISVGIPSVAVGLGGRERARMVFLSGAVLEGRNERKLVQKMYRITADALILSSMPQWNGKAPVHTSSWDFNGRFSSWGSHCLQLPVFEIMRIILQKYFIL